MPISSYLFPDPANCLRRDWRILSVVVDCSCSCSKFYVENVVKGVSTTEGPYCFSMESVGLICQLVYPFVPITTSLFSAILSAVYCK